MVPNDIWLRTEWLSCRRTSVLRCVERYCAAAAREYRRALRRVQEVEETMAQVEPETGRRLPSQPAQPPPPRSCRCQGGAPPLPDPALRL